MIAWLTALTVLQLLQLILVYGLIRRWREQPQAREPAAGRQPSGPGPGSQMPDFTAVDAAGEQVSSAALSTGRVLWGVFSSHCTGCSVAYPLFRDLGHGQRLPMVVIMGVGNGQQRWTPDPTGVVMITEDDLGPIQRRLNITEWPTFIVTDDGAVAYATPSTTRLTAFLADRPYQAQ